MPQLEALVHLSSAYTNCNRTHIGERIYKPPIKADRIIKCTEWITDEMSSQITEFVCRRRPDTYTYTKAIAEYLILEECSNRIPCSIVRPSLVGPSWQDPITGWVESFDSLVALMASMGKGVPAAYNKECTADIIPVDFPVNMMIIAP